MRVYVLSGWGCAGIIPQPGLPWGSYGYEKRLVQVARASGSPAMGGPVPPALVSSSPSLWTLVPHAPGFCKKCFSDLGSTTRIVYICTYMHIYAYIWIYIVSLIFFGSIFRLFRKTRKSRSVNYFFSDRFSDFFGKHVYPVYFGYGLSEILSFLSILAMDYRKSFHFFVIPGTRYQVPGTISKGLISYVGKHIQASDVM